MLLERNKPDFFLVLETGLYSDITPITFHNDYHISLNNYSDQNDAKHSLDRGILLLTKAGIRVQRIFTQWNSDHLLISKAKYENGNELIIVAFHLDCKKK